MKYYEEPPILTADERHKQTMAILAAVIRRDERIAKLERMVYDCVSLRDVMAAGLSQELYNEIVDKFEPKESEDDEQG